MTKKKTTKKALLASALSLLLCFSMLLGTTYAWFTDSVTSANNIIKSGNLDVEFYYSTDAKNWKEVTETTNVFSDTLWEPGHTEVVYLKVENKGSLALKYKLGVNVASEVGGINQAGESFKLSNYILFDVIDTDTAYTDRDAARQAANGKAIANSFSKESVLKTTGDTETVALVVYLPETVGNEANPKTGTAAPEIHLGLNVFATQLTSESDSFGDDYDENAAFSMWDGTIPAEMPASLVVDTAKHVISINDAQAFAYFNTLINDADFYTNYGSKWKYTAELNADIDLANKAWTPIVMSNLVAFEGNNHTVKNLFVDSAAEDAGLFADVTCNDIGVTYVKDLTLDGAYVKGSKNVGAIAGLGTQGHFQNVTVNNATVIGNKYIGGIFGWGNGTVVNSTVKNSSILIPEGGEKEAGGLAGYISNDGKASTENKIISGNTVENVVISAPTIASALVSQPNSSNTGGALIVLEFNTVKNVTVTTADDTADIFASNNVGGKSIVRNNTEIDCTVNKSGALAVFADEQSELDAALENNATVYLSAGDFKLSSLSNYKNITITGVAGETKINPVNSFGFGTDTTVKNVTIESESGNAVRYGYTSGDVVFENCEFLGEVYGFHVDDAHNGTITFNGCTFEGFNAFAGTGTYYFNDCNFLHSGSYGHVNMWGVAYFNNCTWGEGATYGTRGDGEIYIDGVKQ
ncbi:MAG: SipW-dependent-type signal peptide-containing protein [Clostridia bacterium]|nr:SipW-dependent-type signal peptide-containing protein [Clostridia bacterium]